MHTRTPAHVLCTQCAASASSMNCFAKTCVMYQKNNNCAIYFSRIIVNTMVCTVVILASYDVMNEIFM
uniref:Uncharacterized protein n=1 Tax=Trichogramma kaykai TaxID=54128 RepID=A0ABD2WNR6_9HYME